MRKMNEIKANKQTAQSAVLEVKVKEVYLPPRVEVMSIKMERGYAGSADGWPRPNGY